MAKRCCVLDCKETRNKDKFGNKISYHKVPSLKQEVLRKEWLRKIRRRDYFYKPSENIYVCSKHFQNSDFRINQANKQRHLKDDVVPTIFTWDFSTESDSSYNAQNMFTDSSIKKHQDTSLDDAADSGEYSNEFTVSNKIPKIGHAQEVFKWTCKAMPSTFEHDLSNARFQLENPGMDTNLFVSSDVMVPTLLTSIKKEPGIESDDTCDNESNNAFNISGTGTCIKDEPETIISEEPETIISEEPDRRHVDQPEIHIKTELKTSEDEMDTCIDDEPQTCIEDGRETSMKDEPEMFINTTVNSNADCSSVASDEQSVALKLKLNVENKKLKDMVKELESQIALQKIKLLMKEVELSNLKKQLETEITLSAELEKQIKEQSACRTNQES